MDPLDIIERKESGGRNIYQQLVPREVSSASGNFQMIKPTWQRWAKAVGVDTDQYPEAISAPYDVQRRVAAHGFQKEGFKPWLATKDLVGQEKNYSPVQGVLASQGTPAAPAASADLTRFLVSGKDPSILKGVSGDLSSRFAQMVATAPPEVQKQLSILSAYRSREHQERLWQQKLAEVGGDESKARKWVAKPGGSQHEHGNAFDLRYADPAARTWAHANAEKFGLKFPMAHEPWHIETAEARGGTAPTGALAASGTAPSPAAEPQVAPANNTAFNDALAAFQGAQQAEGMKAMQAAQQRSAPAAEPAAPAAPDAGGQAQASDLMSALIERKRAQRIPPPPGLLGPMSWT